MAVGSGSFPHNGNVFSPAWKNRGAVKVAGFGVAAIFGAAEAVFDGDDVLGGEAHAVKDGELEGGAEAADDAEGVLRG